MKLIESILRLLSFKLSRDEMLHFNRSHFIAGLIGTWIVGMGRYWDAEKASILQHLGLGSVIYIFVLAAFIWVILLPFKLDNWKYSTVVTFIGLTSFPAIFYAIPVERFFTVETANLMNVWFLAIVAAWRLGLLFYFLRRFTRLSLGYIITVTLMPICLIIAALTVLNLHNVVFSIMGGTSAPSPHDASYLVLLILTMGSLFLSLPLLISYSVLIYKRKEKLKKESLVMAEAS